MQRHHHAERDGVIRADHGLRLHQRLGEQAHCAVETTLHAALAESVPVGLRLQMMRAHLRMEHGEQFRRFEGDLLAGHVGHGFDALIGQMPDGHLHGGVFVDADHRCMEGALPASDLYDRQGAGILFEDFGEIGPGRGHYDESVHMTCDE